MTMTIETEYTNFQEGDRVRLIDAGGDLDSAAVVGDEGVITTVDEDLLTVEFDNGARTVRMYWRFEAVDTASITVEDREGLEALPIGTDLLLVNCPGLGITIAENGGATWNTDHSNSYQDVHGLPVGAKFEIMTKGNGWLPMTVANPEILGKFAPIPEPLAQWEKELLGIFEVGDIVEIIGDAISEDRRDGWPGLRAVVTLPHTDEGDDAYLRMKPLTDRPDGYERAGFFWEADDVLRLDKPFAIGDRVRITADELEYEVGKEGYVRGFFEDGEADEVWVAVEDGGDIFELGYLFEHLALVASFKQVEIEKAKEAEAAEETRVLAAFEEVTRVGQLDALPAGSVVYESDDRVSPAVKTQAGVFIRVNRFYDGDRDRKRSASTTVYNETESLRLAVESLHREVFVAYVPARVGN